jgi:hypothetical protein
MANSPLEGGNNFKRERYQQLIDLGFSKDWIDEVTLHHPALYDNPKAKIEGLRERGFENPTKLITSLPAILGYAFDNIDAKICRPRTGAPKLASPSGAATVVSTHFRI